MATAVHGSTNIQYEYQHSTSVWLIKREVVNVGESAFEKDLVNTLPKNLGLGIVTSLPRHQPRHGGRQPFGKNYAHL